MSDNVPENPTPDEPAQQPDPQPEPDAPKGDETDWKAMSRKWEKLAKENSKAAEKLAKAEAAAMTEQEKAVAEAKAAGFSEAAKSHGTELAVAKLEAAAAAKGVDISAFEGLIDPSRFVGEDGKVDTTAIGKAVDKLSKSFSGPKRSGVDFNGGNGVERITEAQLAKMSPDEISDAYAKGKLTHLM